MTKNRHDCFKGKSACTPPSRQVTLSFGLTRDFPVGCLLCLVKEVIYFPDPRIKANLHHPPQSQRALLLWRYPWSTKMWTFLEPIIGFTVWEGIRCPLCRHKMFSLWLALSASIHSFKPLIHAASVTHWQRLKKGRALAKNWITLWRLFQGDGSPETGWCVGWIPRGVKLFCLDSLDNTNPVNRTSLAGLPT